MPRPPKWRRVEMEPQFTYFKPAGIPKRILEEVIINVEEIEAIRLKDLEGLEQEECAQKMNISRPTFQRVLTSARSKLAEAIIEGKAIKIEGGNYCLVNRLLKCPACELQFNVSPKENSPDEISCPHCGKKTEN
ncbi:MAG: DUF134 domain-containing protein [Clostridia bacterium]|nr:DUF134 domain-containing protein [Clostridia bacterium]